MLKIIACALLLMTGAAGAATVTVDARLNSSTGGTGLATGILLEAEQAFSVTADPSDTWRLGRNASGCTRESNADGLTRCFRLYTQGNLTARFGSLVGRIGQTGAFFVIGTAFSGTASSAGELFLYAWDTNFRDNSGTIEATIEVAHAPIPAAGLLLFCALGVLTIARRRATA